MFNNVRLLKISFLLLSSVVTSIISLNVRGNDMYQYGEIYTLCGSLGQGEFWSNDMYHKKSHWIHYYKIYVPYGKKNNILDNQITVNFEGSYVALYPDNGKSLIKPSMIHKYVCVIGKILPIYHERTTYLAYMGYTKIWLYKSH